ncbi:MAG: tRNA (guanosine(46)-N7)-methyltransferase TrmB [Verrucomicrobiales bacterium]|nr:tRNA (guanosine(46)-N7)-methyltransferase TrmB [Verrucomicrobiales bacterium]
MSNLKHNGELRWSPSYLRRQGKVTPAQKRALRDNWNRFGIEFRYGDKISLNDHFSSSDGPLHLEIGFGMGENLIYQAKTVPDSRILGIEVHKPGIGAALKKIEEEQLQNIRVMRGDARLILSDYLDESTRFDQISVLFPDPWPDPENAHRRIIQTDLIELFARKIRHHGHLHIASDVDLYRDHVESVMAHHNAWKRITDFEITSLRGPTRYETRGLEMGHRIHDLYFQFDPCS